jgi:peptidoglycan/xylan/chitin deacetylase (PgdA/CDA1 family)
MESRAARPPRPDDRHRRRRPVWPARLLAAGSLIVVAAVIVSFISAATRGSGSHNPTHRGTRANTTPAPTTRQTTGTAVPILAYRIINTAPPQSSASPSLYVPTDEFSAQMTALKAGGWHAVTLDQLQAYWTHGTPLGTSKPIVITFDQGYASQYTNALPILKQLGWVGVENLQLSGLSPSDGGLTGTQIQGLVSAGWELDTEGVSQDDLTVLSPTQLQSEVTTARQTLSGQYHVPVNWFSYPSGSYDATVIAAVQAAGYVGATTIVPGWASPQGDRFRLPRLVVLAGTSPSALLSQITTAQQQTSIPGSFHGTPGT